MVYCGKPSRGCQMCRTRRIKCDETRPTCNQCAKSRRQCPGYRDEFDIVHRNETQATQIRARKAVRKPVVKKPTVEPPSWPSSSSSDSSKSEESHAFSPAGSDSSSSSVEELPHNPTVPIQDHAACLFVSNFILVPRQETTRGYMDFVLPLMRTAGPGSPLAYAFGACAYAALGNRPHVRKTDVTLAAVMQYQRALQALQTSLQDKEAAKSDATLAAVLLLALYEHLTYTGMGVGSWAKHIEGAIKLVESRGRSQLQTRRGLLLFIAVRTQLIVHSMTSGLPPAHGVDYWVNDAVNDVTATNCQRLCLQTNTLRAEVTRLLTANVRSQAVSDAVSALIKQMKALDDETRIWLETLPRHFRYVTVGWENNVPDGDYARAEVYPGRVDVYRDFWIASVVNMGRVTRIALISTILRCVAWVRAPADYRTTPEYASAVRVSTAVITDILASVPYHLGWHLKRPDAMRRANLSGFGCGDEYAEKSLPGYFLNLPLAAVQNQDSCTDSQRAWVKGRLNYVASELGVRYAGVIAKLDVRLPSMHIRRDNLFAKPYPVAHNFEKVLSSRAAYEGATAGSEYPMDPFKQMEAVRKGFVDQKRAEMLEKAGGGSGKEGERLAEGLTLLRPPQ